MSSEIAIRHDVSSTGLSLSEGPDPASAVAYAAQVSTQVASVLEEGNGYVTIQRKKHVTIEGWQSLAAMTGHSVEVQWSRPVEGMEPNGQGVRAWEARAVVTDQNGRVVAAGESMAEPAEKAPWTKTNFSVRSMAQTRAMSRALSSRMRYIVQLAGFSGTPAEEVGGEDKPDPLAVARGRWRVIRDTLGQADEVIKERVGDKPERLAEDGHFAYVAFMLGCDSVAPHVPDDEPVEGEVVEASGDDAVADEIAGEVFQETGEVINDRQRKRLFAISREKGVSDEWVKAIVLDLTGQDSRSKIPVSKYESVIAAIEAGPAAEHVAAGGEALFPAERQADVA